MSSSISGRKHQHPLTYTTTPYGSSRSWSCDLCRCSGSTVTGSNHCNQCGYDECPSCYTRNSGADEEKKKSKAAATDEEGEFADDEDLEDREYEEGETRPARTMRRAFKDLCCQERFADCHFLVVNEDSKTKERIPGHRFILGVANDVFRALLYPLNFSSDMKTAERDVTTPLTSDIEIPDTTAPAFKKMLQCLYTDKVDMTIDDIKDLLPLAKRFQVDSLRVKCSEFMEQDITVDNVCAMLEQGRKLLNEPKFGMSVIEENTREVLESKGFLTLSADTVASILRSNKLNATEAELFEAVDRWSEAECKRRELEVNGTNKRQVLGDTVDLIRFPCLTMQELVTTVQPSNLLTAQELLSLFTYLGASKSSKPKIKWMTTPREGATLFKGSTLLKPEQQKQLSEWYGKEKKGQWELVYHAKDDGMTASSFHAKVDSIYKPTITIIKSTNNDFLFGGYTEQGWSGSSNYKSDSNAWIFSLVNRPKRPVKCTISSNSYAIYAQSSYGPTFGSGFNIYCCQNFNTNSNYCSHSECYRLSDQGITSSNYYDYFGGQYNFTVADIEVFALKSKS